MKVYFIGSGPGDPDLLTVRANHIIKKAGVIVYAGSLVSSGILKLARRNAVMHDSAGMSLEEIFRVLKKAKRTGKTVARLHSGDPSLYGAIQEQMEWCRRKGVEYEVIPGVSSFFAACASLKQELTLPGISQSVIITRISGRTKVPAREDLKRLSKIKATLVIFLSADRVDEVVERLRYGYDRETPVACVYRASWPDEKVIRGTLRDIADRVKNAGIKRQALIFVGEVLRKRQVQKSKLYDKTFPHSYRRARLR